MKKQRGGTLLGLVIGALLGLGIALTVAVYVTKVPVPFLNKSQPHNPDSDAAESKKNRDWNPNASLAGKNPARPVPSASGELSPSPETDPATSVPDPVLAPDELKKPDRVVKAPKAAASAPASAKAIVAKPVKPESADPLGDLAKSRSGGSTSPTGSDPFNYFIQAGAYRTPEDAEQQRARLLLLGMQAKVTEREQAGRTVYRVRIGPFDKKDEADKVKNRLDNNSVETALVRVQR
ncbi:MAG: SPOR domain-containing protein [Polaromonas sp.]